MSAWEDERWSWTDGRQLHGHEHPGVKVTLTIVYGSPSWPCVGAFPRLRGDPLLILRDRMRNQFGSLDFSVVRSRGLGHGGAVSREEYVRINLCTASLYHADVSGESKESLPVVAWPDLVEK